MWDNTYIDFKLGSGQDGESSSQESEQSDKADVLPQRANAVDGPRGFSVCQTQMM
jgi:hypothetical protein